MVSQLLLWEMATWWQHVFMPSSGYWGNQSLGESPVPGLPEWKVPEAALKACVPFFFLPYPCPLDTSQFLQRHSGEGAFIHRWGDPKQGRWRWEAQHQETWNPRGFSEFFQLRASTSFSRRSFTAGGPAWIWRLWARVEEQAHPVYAAGLIGWHTLPSSVSPMTVHPWEPSLPRLQGCDSSPGHQGLRGIELTFILCNLYLVLVCRWLTVL